MSILQILLIVVLILCALMLMDVSVRISFVDSAKVQIGFLGIYLTVIGGKKKKKAKKAKAKKSKTAKTKATEKKQKQKKKKMSLGELISLILDIIKAVAGPSVWLVRKIRVKKLKAIIIVASDDCAKTAQDYGKMCAVVYGAVGYLQNQIKMTIRRVFVGFDFQKTKSQYDVSFKLNIRLCYLVYALIRMLLRFIGNTIKKSTYTASGHYVSKKTA